MKSLIRQPKVNPDELTNAQKDFSESVKQIKMFMLP